jgi:ubiquinone/menaquinone biosynthesis C-methylase UbiE
MGARRLIVTLQNQATIATNSAWFKNNDRYVESQNRLTCYRHMQRVVEREIRGSDHLLDIGNGGFFNYDTATVGHVTAVDLFLENGPGPTSNSSFREGSFLNLPFPDQSFDCVLQQNVLHHVTGRTVSENFVNMRQCISEMFRILRPGGKAVVVESTVGPLFNLFERVVYRPFLWIKRGGHPVTFQFTANQLNAAAQKAGFELEEFSWIPRGAFLLQFGYLWPSILTPASPVKLIFRRPRARRAS